MLTDPVDVIICQIQGKSGRVDHFFFFSDDDAPVGAVKTDTFDSRRIRPKHSEENGTAVINDGIK